MTSESSALELRGVTRAFGGHRAVDDVSFRVEPGTITGLIGPNGAGKTTVFNLIAGALRPSAGRIALGGRRLDGRPPHLVLRAGVARTFQIPRPFAAMTVLENVMLAELYVGTPRKGRRERALAALDRVGPVSYTHLTLPTIYSV